MSRALGGRPLPAPVIDIMVEAPIWATQRGAKTVLRRAIAAAAAAVPAAAGELSVVLTNDPAIRTLNRTWRGKDEPTNVLSFPATEPHHRTAGCARREHAAPPRHLGDIVIAYETTAREAAAEDKPFRHHLAHLAVHGFLHLAGYDHEADAEADAMEALEIAVLARLKVPNPYIARDAKG
jgi:probable rRNA maturation factor